MARLLNALMFKIVGTFFGRCSREQAADNQVYSREQGEDVNKASKVPLWDGALQAHTQPCAHRHKQAKCRAPAQRPAVDQPGVEEERQLDTVDPCEDQHTGGDVGSLGDALR